MADSPNLPAIQQAPNPGLVGYVAAYYLPQADLAADPVLATPGLVVQDLALTPGAGWLPLPYTPNTLKLEETPKTERGVTTYQVRVSADRPQPSAAVLSALAALERRPLLLLLVEASGQRRLLGTRDEYLLLLTTGQGQHPGAKAGLELRFEGLTTHLAPYYQGAVPVLTGASLPAVGAAPGQATGYVNIFSKRGKLMARVPVGHDVTITSSFKVTLAVK